MIMQLGGFSGGILSLCNWFARLAYINILWILFSLAGLIVFGFFPATIAMLATLRQFLQKNDPPVFKTFWKYYKAEFFASNKLGAIIVVIGLVLLINITFLQSMDNKLSEMLYYPTIVLSCIYLLAICYLLASYVEFEQNLKTHIKNSLLIMVYNPLSSLFIIFGFTIVYYAVTTLSGLGFFFSGSLLGLVILSSTSLTYRKIERKQAKLQTEEKTA